MNIVVFWSVSISFLIASIYLLSDILSPFFIAFIFAYLLQPAIDAYCKYFKWPRSIVAFGIFSIFLSVFTAIMTLIAPVIYKQITIFIDKIPQYKTIFEKSILLWSEKLDKIDPEFAIKINEFMQNFINSAFIAFSSLVNYIWQYTIATINFFTIIALTPIILYYFLRDWPKMVSSIESVLPMRGKSKVCEIFTSINELLAAYIRGQLNICLILTIYYVTAFQIIGLDLGLLLGILSGFLIIIPFIGAIISFLFAMISCYFTFGSGVELIYLSAVFIFGHTLEGYILAPKIIGNKIGLHPVWIIFAVFAAGSLFGFFGILFAIPLAGITKVCITHIIDYYKSSSIYNKL